MRSTPLLVATVSLVLALGGCSSPDEVVATVDGVDVLESHITSLREGEGPTVSAESFRQDLMIVIAQLVITEAAADEYGIRVDQAAVDTEVQRILDGLEGSGQTVGDLLRIEGATDEMLRRNIEASLLRQQVVAAIREDPVRIEGIFNDLPQLFTNLCARHILVGSEEDALQVLERLDAGEEFAALAAEVSLDTSNASNGGELGCSPASRYVTAFANAAATAELDGLTGPVETEFGWHVLTVYDRTTVSLDEVVADPAQHIPDEILTGDFVNWFNEKLRAAEVTVDPAVGTWFPEGPGIVPPAELSE